MLKRTAKQLSLLSLASMAVVACSGEDRPQPTDKIKPKVVAFAASPTSVAPGGTTVLSWEVTDATTVKIDVMGGGSVQAATELLMGNVTSAALDATTVFILTAVNDDQTTTANVTVIVEAQATPAQITELTATPPMVAMGGSTTLAWKTSNAVSGVIRAGGAELYTIPASDLAVGSYQVPVINQATTFTLAVRGADNVEVTQDVSVTITAQPMPAVVSFSATPPSITAGGQTTLAWNVTNATSVVVTGPASGQVYSGANLMGSATVMPGMTETFTLVASDGANSAMATAVVTVTAPMGASITSFSASPATVQLGTASTLSWSVVNATGGIEISDGTAIVTTSNNAMGSFAVTPAVTTTYTLRAINPVMDATSTAVVTVNAAAPGITYFLPNPTLVARGGTTQLSWRTVGADSIRVLQNGAEIYTTTTNAAMGMYTATVTDLSTTFVLEATNTLGTNTFSVTVAAHDPPVINSFEANPPYFAGGSQAITLTWDCGSVNELLLTANGVAAPGFTPVNTGDVAGPQSGSATVTITQDTTFELIARSAAGEVRQTRVVAGGVAELEPNDTQAGAQVLPSGGLITSELNPAGEVDWFAIVVPQGGYIVAETSDGQGGCVTDTYMDLIAPDGTTVLATNDDINFPANPCSAIDGHTVAEAANLDAGTYYVVVRGYDPTVAGPYSISVTAGAPACANGIAEYNNPAPEQCDDGNTVPGDGCDAACRIETLGLYTAPGPDTAFPGSITPAGDVDFFQLVVTSTTYVLIETFAPTAASGTCTGVDTVIFLTNESLQILAEDDEGGVDSCSSLYVELSPGTYYVAVVDYLGGEILAYEVAFHSTTPNVCGNGVPEGAANEQCDDGNTVPGDGCSATCTLEINPTIVAYPGATATVDLLTATSFAIVQVDTGVAGRAIAAIAADVGGATCNVADTGIDVYTSDLQYLGTVSANGPTGTAGDCAALRYPEDTFAADLAAGSYYLVVYAENGAIGQVEVAVTLHDAVCGNGLAEPNAGEGCDDGNLVSGDGCSALCVTELPLVEGIEPNDLPATAQAVGPFPTGPLSQEIHDSISPATDRDFFTFTITATTTAIINTFGTPGQQATTCPEDTQLYLYNAEPADLNATTSTAEPALVAYNDDGGYDLCSWIGGTYNAPAPITLVPGTYWVQARSYNGTVAIPSYYIGVNLQ